jgi:UDP-2,4-diacetamido-2,4,6-trideoxy-beta-L-altropyranose hydrolase
VKVIIRVDAFRQIGSGHFVRCLTLADALRNHGVRCRFVCRQAPDEFAQNVLSHGHQLVRIEAAAATTAGPDGTGHSLWLGASQEYDAAQTTAVLGEERPDWLVVDHYALDHSWEGKFRPLVGKILVIDDLADRRHDCDVLVDPNLYQDADSRYAEKVPAHCQLLLGPRYALLRDEFLQARLWTKPRSGSVRRILVFFGGVDEENHTAVTIQALTRLNLKDVHVDIVIGAQNSNRKEIESTCNANDFALHVQTDRMAELMAAADLAVGAAGSATWERCCVGLPSLAIAVASNQRQLIHDSALAGLVYAPTMCSTSPERLAQHLSVLIENPSLLAFISRNSAKIVDGRGARRVLRAMGISPLRIRRAVLADSRSLFEWRNDFSIRRVSRSTSPLDWPSHASWLESVLTDPYRPLLIGELAEQPVGVVRFDLTADQAEVSIYMIPGQHQQGMGVDLLYAAERWLVDHRLGIRVLTAEVLADNQASHELFASAGYRASSTCYEKRMK